jgi:hypothetical protein
MTTGPAGDLDVFVMKIGANCLMPMHYGQGTPGSSGIVPAISTAGGFPSLGNAGFAITGSQLLGGAPVLLGLGTQDAALALGGITVLVDIGLPALFFTGVASGTPGVPGSGTVAFSAPVPADPAFAGVVVFAQLAVGDPAGPQGLAATDGLRIVICSP